MCKCRPTKSTGLFGLYFRKLSTFVFSEFPLPILFLLETTPSFSFPFPFMVFPFPFLFRKVPLPFPFFALHFLFLRERTESFPFVFNPSLASRSIAEGRGPPRYLYGEIWLRLATERESRTRQARRSFVVSPSV